MVEGQEGWYCWLLGGQTVVNMAADHLRLVSNTNEQELQVEAERHSPKADLPSVVQGHPAPQ